MRPTNAALVGPSFAAIVIHGLNPLYVISLALFTSLGYILTLFMPVTMAEWQGLFWATLAGPLAVMAARARGQWRQFAGQGPEIPWRAALPMLVLLPAFWAEVLSPSLQIMHHGDIHIGYIHQLMYESTPIDNVFLAGHPANYYWLYHAYLATVSQITGFSPASVSSLVNMLAILSSLLWIGRTLRLLGLGESRSIALGLMALLVYFSINLTSTPTLLAHVFNGTYTPHAFDIMRLPGADERLHSVMGKVMNFNSVTLGIMAFSAALYGCARLVKGKIDLQTLALVSAAGIAALAVRELAALAIVFALLGGIVVMAAFHGMRGPYRPGQVAALWRSLGPRWLIAWLIVSLILSLPLLKYNLDIVGSFDAGRPFGLSGANVKRIVAALALLLPLYGLQFVFLLRRYDVGKAYIQLSCSLAMGLALVLKLPDDNQYKCIYFAGILMAIASLSALQTLRSQANRRARKLGWVCEAALYFLVLSQILYVSSNYVNRVGIFAESGYRYRGAHIEHTDGIDGRQPAYLWIRDNTPLESIVILPIVPSKFSNLFHERMLYVRLLQLHFKASVLVYEERVRNLELLYSADTSLAEYRALIEGMASDLPSRPFYAVVKDSELAPAVMEQRGAALVFEGEADGAKVYLLNPGLGSA